MEGTKVDGENNIIQEATFEALPPVRVSAEKKCQEAQQMICVALGEAAVSYSTYKKWFRRFKVDDEELEQLLDANPCFTQSELAQELGVIRQAIAKHLQKLGRIHKKPLGAPPTHSLEQV